MTLRLVAMYADACNIFAGADEQGVRHKLDVLKSHCDKVGRNYDEIEKTCLESVNLSSGNITSHQMIDRCRKLSEMGISHIIFNMPNVSEIRPLEIIGKEVIPQVKDF